MEEMPYNGSFPFIDDLSDRIYELWEAAAKHADDAARKSGPQARILREWAEEENDEAKSLEELLYRTMLYGAGGESKFPHQEPPPDYQDPAKPYTLG